MNRAYLSFIQREGEKPVVYELEKITLFSIEQKVLIIEPDNPSSAGFVTRVSTDEITITIRGRLVPKP